MIQGVSFDGLHCQNDLGMLLASKSIDFPTVQTTYVNVPGRNGPLDLTEALSGEPKYNSRIITLNFVTCKNIAGKDWPGFITPVAELLHGKKVKIVFDDDKDHYYLGRGELGALSNSKGKLSFTVTFTCEPFKYDEDGNTSM